MGIGFSNTFPVTPFAGLTHHVLSLVAYGLSSSCLPPWGTERHLLAASSQLHLASPLPVPRPLCPAPLLGLRGAAACPEERRVCVSGSPGLHWWPLRPSVSASRGPSTCQAAGGSLLFSPCPAVPTLRTCTARRVRLLGAASVAVVVTDSSGHTRCELKWLRHCGSRESPCGAPVVW